MVDLSDQTVRLVEFVENFNCRFVLPQPGKATRRGANMRDNGFWRESLETRRCLVPASAFCEPNGEAGDVGLVCVEG